MHSQCHYPYLTKRHGRHVCAGADEGDRGFGGGGDRGRGSFNHSSYDDSDPFTTNLYVGNIHPEVSLTALTHI